MADTADTSPGGASYRMFRRTMLVAATALAVEAFIVVPLFVWAVGRIT